MQKNVRVQVPMPNKYDNV